MRKFLIGGVLLAGLSVFAGPSNADLRILGDIRGNYKQIVAQYQELNSQLTNPALPSNPTEARLKEFIKQCALQQMIAPVVKMGSHSGNALIWTNPSRLNDIPFPVQVASAFNNGPDNAIIPFSGEFTDSASDVVLLQRGGLGFSFERKYSALSVTDYGLGVGWDYNYNATIRRIDNNALLMHWQGRDIVFTLSDNKEWLPQAGEFFSLDVRNEQIEVVTPILTKIVFEPSQEKSNTALSRWRLASIATRHDNGNANHIKITYLGNCDRIQFITDPFGQKIDFAYDLQGHIIQVATSRDFVNLTYDADGFLIQAIYPDRIISFSQKIAQKLEYTYLFIGKYRLMSCKSASGYPYSLKIEYDDKFRVVKCGYFSSDAKQLWQYLYSDDEVVMIPPAPSPETHYSFGNPLHPSLPQMLAIPTQNAKWHYQYGNNLQISEDIDPLGVKTIYRYDLDNYDRKFRGNLLQQQTIPIPGVFAYWLETGTETQYHPEIALPIKNETYQISTDGKRTIVKYQTIDYSPNDYMPVKENNNGIVNRFIYNRFGKISMEIDANDNVTIYQYSEKLPDKTQYDFASGNAVWGGLLVSKTQDATQEQIILANKTLEQKPLSRAEITRIVPVALEVKTAWDIYNNPIRTVAGHSQTLSINTPSGSSLASFDSASGMKLYNYSPLGKALSIKHEFCPTPDARYQGESSLYFSGNFYSETFDYDSLGQMVSRTPTSEPAQTDEKLHSFSFTRYPNGKIKSITNPDGVKRVDIYDEKTGWVQNRLLEGVTGVLRLNSDFQYYPNGATRSYRDQFGGVWENLIDGFGDIYGKISPNKVISKQKSDAAGRILMQTVEDDSGIISKQENSYSAENGLLDAVTTWRIAPDINMPIITAKYLYDKAGNQIGQRGIQEKSWTYALFDGLNRQVGTKSPTGDMNFAIFDQDAKVFDASRLFKADQEYWQTGTLSTVDYAGRPITTIPVDKSGKLIQDRSNRSDYDIIGHLVRTESTGLTEQTIQYNTIGKILTEETRPMTKLFGEIPVSTRYLYSPGGNLLKKTLSNRALLLKGNKDKSIPELLDAPQETEYKYDEFGRQVDMIQPDGLIVHKGYSEFTLPQTMTWTHIAEPEKILRKLAFQYTVIGQVDTIFSALTQNKLRSFTYDNNGNCIKSVDYSSTYPVELLRGFDSMGLQLSEELVWNNLPSPKQILSYDLHKGSSAVEWRELEITSLVNWKKIVSSADATGRLTSLSLNDDKELYVQWECVGELTTKRSISESGMETLHRFSDLNEPLQTIFNGRNYQRFGTLEYGYGAQGQAEFTSTKIGENTGKPYTFAMYAQFDSYRRLVAQNGEVKIPDSKNYSERQFHLFGSPEKSLAALNTARMQYDQADNIWVSYSGALLTDFSPNQVKSSHNPLFTSPALPTIGKGDLLLRELASNREAAKAAFVESEDTLKSEEFIYDRLGNLIEYDGQFWNGHLRYPVKWQLEYDDLGRLTKMIAKAKEDTGFVKKDAIAGEMSFVYDAENRRIAKAVMDYSIANTITKSNTSGILIPYRKIEAL